MSEWVTDQPLTIAALQKKNRQLIEEREAMLALMGELTAAFYDNDTDRFNKIMFDKLIHGQLQYRNDLDVAINKFLRNKQVPSFLHHGTNT